MTDGIKQASKARRRARAAWTAAALLLACGLGAVPAAGQEATPVLDLTGLPSENTAFALSLLGTGISVACAYSRGSVIYIGLIGFFGGPSLGAMYGGLWGRAALFTGLRAVASLIIAGAAYADESHGGEGYVVALVSGLALTAVIEMATIRRAVRHRNELRARARLDVGWTPVVMPKGAGLQVRLSF